MEIVVLSCLALVIWTASATDQTKEVFCMFGGASVYTYEYKFNVDDLKNSLQICTACVYGRYYFDRSSGINDTKFTNQVLEEDRIAIRSIVKTGLPVYLMVAYETDWNLWTNLLNATDPTYVDNQVEILVSFVLENKIRGIIYENLRIYNNIPEPLTDLVIKLTQHFKEKFKSLKVGLYVYGRDYWFFENDKYFNYTSSNIIIDHYLIGMTDLNKCSPITKNDGVNPIHSKDPDLTTIEKVCKAIKKSHMKKSNVFATLKVFVTGSQEGTNNDELRESYRQLCLDAVNNNNTSTTQWCLDTTETLYDQGQFVADYTGNIMVREIQADDYSGSCQCSKFIATNTIIYGWQSGNKKSCNAIDKLKPGS